MILGRKRIDAGVDADVANKEIRTLDKVSYLINISPAETTCSSCHHSAPSLPQRNICILGDPQVPVSVWQLDAAAGQYWAINDRLAGVSPNQSLADRFIAADLAPA